jgi:hypothetical protein
MPYTVNGIGTALSGNFAPIHWKKPGLLGDQPDHDAFECFVVFFFPLLPLRAVHTFGWSGNQYRKIPLRRTGALLAHVYLRMLVLLLTVGGAALVVISAFIAAKSIAEGGADREGIWIVPIVALVPVALGFGLLRLQRASQARTRDIRLVIGPHQAGSSDPALWEEKMVGGLKPAALGDSRSALASMRFAEAMLTARLAAAQRAPEAEQLTDEILAHPEVQATLPALRREPWRRDEILGGAGWAAVAPAG